MKKKILKILFFTLIFSGIIVGNLYSNAIIGEPNTSPHVTDKKLDGEGEVVDNGGESKVEGDGTEIKSSSNITYYSVDLEFVGFRVGYRDETGKITEHPKKITNKENTLDWGASGLIITRLVKEELTYSTDKGVAYGKVIATSHYAQSKVGSRTFEIPFKIFDDEIFDVTVYSTNPNLGGVFSSKNFAKAGENVKVWVEEYVQDTFKYWFRYNENKEKEIVTYSKEYSFKMPDVDVVLYAYFENEVETHNLYVTSNNPNWGEAWTYDNEQNKIWHNNEAVTGREYDIKYEAKPGYEFVRWEYRPRYENSSEKNGKIVMPRHDITVTAIFKERDIIKRNDPTLYISVNNPSWGDAYIVTKTGNIYASQNPIGSPNSFVAQYNETYDIVYNPKDGYYFTGWITSPEIGLNLFADQLTMPNNNLTLTAFFSPIPEYGEGEVYLHDITTRVEPPEGGKIVGNIPDKLPEGDKFTVSAEGNEGYALDYWYYEDPNGNKIILGTDPTIEITMPGHAIELVAVFHKLGTYKLYVTSNNTIWGEAYTEADNGNKVWERLATEGKEYPINQIAKPGCEFVRWEYSPTYKNPSEQNGQIKMPGYDITVTAIFREIVIPKDEPRLYISVNNPEWGEAYVVTDSGKVYANKDPEGAPNSFKAESGKTYKIVYIPKDGYYFTGWITSPEIGLDKSATEITMGDTDLTLTAFFSHTSDDDVDEDEKKPGDDEKYSLTVKTFPEEAAISTSGSRNSAKVGNKYPVSVKLRDNWNVVGWYYDDKSGKRVEIPVASTNMDFEMLNQDVVLYADCVYNDEIIIGVIPTPIPDNSKSQPFLITSIRDLRWKDHFVDNKGNYKEENALTIPDRDTVVAEYKGYPTELKMGYAVEFSMTTAMVAPENAKLVIKPKVIIGNSTKEIDPGKLYDAMGSKLVELGKKYSEIVIYGDNRNPNTNFQTKATPTLPKPKNNDVEYDEITWEWLYYLPADIRNTDGRSKITEDITIKFDIEVYDGEKVADYITYLSKNNLSNWKGKVFKYSWKDSVLDDIYNNAQN